MTSITGHAPASYAGLPRLMSLMTGDAKHDQAATSTLDVLWVLYDRVLRVTPETVADDTRDRFLLSKGHGPMAYYAVLAAKGFLDPRLAVVLADISADSFEPARRRYPDRVINLGIREQLLISVTGGLALAGLRPVAHTFASFLVERPFEQIKLDLNHQGAGAVLVSAGASYDFADNGRTHQSPGDVALLGTLPGWTVHVPGHPDEAQRQLRAAATGQDLVYLRLSTAANSVPLAAAPGRLTVLRTGRQGTVLVVGPLADAVLDATLDLDVTVLYAATIRPLDTATLRDTLRAPAVVLVEPYLAGTSLPAVSGALRDIPHRILGLGVGRAELRRYGTAAQHQAAHGLDARSLRESITGFLGG